MGKRMGRQGKHGRKMKEDKGRTTHEFITSIRAPELILYSVYIYMHYVNGGETHLPSRHSLEHR
jgi:hypothetical protein